MAAIIIFIVLVTGEPFHSVGHWMEGMQVKQYERDMKILAETATVTHSSITLTWNVNQR